MHAIVARRAVLTVHLDAHAPPRFRVDGPLSQFPPFAQSFGCLPGDAMVAKPQCPVFGTTPPDPP